MPPGFSRPGPFGIRDFHLKYRLLDDDQERVRQAGPLGGPFPSIEAGRFHLLDPKQRLKLNLAESNRRWLESLIDGLHAAPSPAALFPPPLGGVDSLPGKGACRCTLGPLTPDETVSILMQERRQSLATEVNKTLLLEQVRREGITLWLVYENDGDPPFNPGSGSDQGPTARLALYATFDHGGEGLKKLGVTVIDMRTPRGYLPQGARFGSESDYQTARGPYSGIASVDFEVTVHKTGRLEINVLGSAGIDSTDWQKLVQDAIHTYVSDSPLFPSPRGVLRPFAEAGVVALYSPRQIMTRGEVLGLSYKGTLEFEAGAVTGTHRTEGSAGARLVLRSTAVRTTAGRLSVEYSPLGTFVRGFARYNDGREAGHFGVEGGVNSRFLVRLGRFGIGLEGTITSSTDPALQTGNPAGSGPLLNPLSGQDSRGGPLGGPRGHHGTGRLLLLWSF